MNTYKKNFERSVGESFIDWYNRQNNTNFAFRCQGESPDLTYRDGAAVLHVEVTSAYYDKRHAKSLWQNARREPNAPKGWGGIDFDKALKEEIEKAIADKCDKNYGPDCVVLVVDVTPVLTGADEMESQLGEIRVPSAHRFAGIYLTGDFPVTSTSPGGYRCWRLDR